MRNLVMHVDGSRVLSPCRTSQANGWAVLACHDGELHEVFGAFPEGRKSVLTGYHEQIAFVQGVLYAHSQGIPFSDVTIICDDTVFGYAQYSLHPENYAQRASEQVRGRLSWTVSQCFEPFVESLVLQAFSHARIHKVKGHRREVYQERVDYLAKYAAKKSIGLAPAEMLSLDDWLQKGLLYYEDHAQPPKTWYAPFLELTDAPACHANSVETSCVC